MIGEKLTYYENFRKINSEVILKLSKQFNSKKKLCIAVGGESGSGKTSLAFALLTDIERELGLKGYLFHGDDYFKIPPKDNHNKRLEDISNVGASEVKLELLDEHISGFINGKESLKKPLVNYSENSINEEVICPDDFDFCIVEGTYTMLLNQPSFKIFIKNSFIDTKANREKRARDVMDDFIERVLEIEHKIIKAQAKFADLIVENNI